MLSLCGGCGSRHDGGSGVLVAQLGVLGHDHRPVIAVPILIPYAKTTIWNL